MTILYLLYGQEFLLLVSRSVCRAFSKFGGNAVWLCAARLLKLTSFCFGGDHKLLLVETLVQVVNVRIVANVLPANCDRSIKFQSCPGAQRLLLLKQAREGDAGDVQLEVLARLLRVRHLAQADLDSAIDGQSVRLLPAKVHQLLLVYDDVSVDDQCLFVRMLAIEQIDRHRLPVLGAIVVFPSLLELEVPMVRLLGPTEKFAYRLGHEAE